MKKKKLDEETEVIVADEGDVSNDDRATMTGWDTKKVLLRRILTNVRQQLDQMERLMESEAESFDGEVVAPKRFVNDRFEPSAVDRAVEGVFDGEQMIGEDGQRYQVPPNYSSKSKLVEGDLLRLTITDDGRFLYKQRGPIERERVMGVLMQDEHTNEWKAYANGKKYSVLTASVTFFKGQVGDEVVILVPRGTPSSWAAIENIVKRTDVS